MNWVSNFFYSCMILFSFPACQSTGEKEEKEQIENKLVSLDHGPISVPDSLLLKYKNQVRPAGYTGLMMYDLLILAYTPIDEFQSALAHSGYDWEKVAESNDLTFGNKNCRQYLSKLSDDELFFVDYTPYHKANYEYLKANGYFSYEDTQLGNSYFNCDSIFVTWRLNEDDPKGGSGLLFYNVSDF